MVDLDVSPNVKMRHLYNLTTFLRSFAFTNFKINGSARRDVVICLLQLLLLFNENEWNAGYYIESARLHLFIPRWKSDS